MSKLERNRGMFFGSWDGSLWDAIGKDNDDLSKELNPDTEASKNVLGETTFKHSGYAPEVDVDPYYMDPERNMYQHMLECALEEKYGEADLLGKFAEAFFTSVDPAARTMSGYAYVRDAWFVPQSVGGDTSGFAIPYTVTPVGAMVKKAVTYDMATNTPTFTDWPGDELVVTSVANATTSGSTDITVEPAAPGSGNKYYYRIAAGAINVNIGDVISTDGGSAWTELTLSEGAVTLSGTTTGQVLTVVRAKTTDLTVSKKGHVSIVAKP